MDKNRSASLTAQAWLIISTILFGLTGDAAEFQTPLRAGAAAVNITADKPAVPVHDPLMAKVLILDDGSNKAVIVCMDILEAKETITDGIRRGVKQDLGIEPSNVLVNVAQNHRTENQEAKDLVERVVAAVKKASQNMVPAKIGVGTGNETRITMNRRLRTKDGKHWTIRQATPSPADADVAGLGPMDPQIGILRVDTLAGKPLALLYNFAGHPYAGVPGGGVTADFPAFASKVIEEAWPGAVALFLQGFCGDITPIRYKDFQSAPPTIELGTKLGQSVLKAAQDISTSVSGTIRAVHETVALPRRTDTPERIKELLAEQERILQSLTPQTPTARGAGMGLNFESFLPLYLKLSTNPDYPSSASYSYQQEEQAGQKGLRQLDVQNKRRVESYRRCVGDLERLITIRMNISLLRSHLDRLGAGPIPMEIQAMKLGDFVVVTSPAEPFAEIGLRIKKQSPLPHTFVAGNSNGAMEDGGYYGVMSDAYDKQAYEDSITQLAPQWQEIYERKALELIRRVREP